MGTSDTTIMHIGSDGEVRVEAKELETEIQGHRGPLRVHLHTDAVRRKVDEFLRELVKGRLEMNKLLDASRPEMARRVEVAIKTAMVDVEREIKLELSRLGKEAAKRAIDGMNLVVSIRSQ